MSWRVEGDYFEVCNCRSICPCIFLGDPSDGGCRDVAAWHIEKGEFESVKLNGLNVVGMFYAPGNMVKGPKWQSALYLDDRAGPEEAEALTKIFSGQAGGHLAVLAAFIGEVKGIRSVPIEFTAGGKQRRLRIPNVAQLNVEGVAGGNPNQESRVTNPALAVVSSFDPIVAHSTRAIYKDYGMDWDNSGKNAFYSRFVYSA